MNLFAYGTLMEPRVLTRVTGTWPRAHNASLPSYRRLAFKNESYPGIIPAAKNESVNGILFFDLNGLAWQHLDSFEGDIYERVTVSVILAPGARVAAQTYVVSEAYWHLLASYDWDFQVFLQRDLSAYLIED